MNAITVVSAILMPAVLLATSEDLSTAGKRCQEITIPMCRGVGYNTTYTPNQFGHETQEEAGLEVHQFWPLVEIQCSPDLRFFLCSTYAPICVANYRRPLPACRSVCERARAGCSPLMQQYGFAWPDRLRCADLPEYGDRVNLCMDFDNHSLSTTGVSSGKQVAGYISKRPPRVHVVVGTSAGSSSSSSSSSRTGSASMSKVTDDDDDDDCKCRCRAPFVAVVNQSSPYYGRVSAGGEANCAMPCDGVFFSGEERRFVRYWISVWAVLCVLSTTLTLLTFAVDSQRFRYPERSIVYLSACYLFVAVGYLAPIADSNRSIPCEPGFDGGEPMARYDATGSLPCVFVFLVVYFFGMASNVWWVVLALTWFLTAGLKWSHESVARRSHYFHLAAWLVPSLKVAAVLTLSAVDADPVSGLCYVGARSVANRTAFVVLPLGAYLLVGTSFLVAGFLSLVRARRVIRMQQNAKTDKLDNFMIRIGVASVLYTVPATTVVFCHLYEQRFRSHWERAINCPPCSNGGGYYPSQQQQQHQQQHHHHHHRHPEFFVIVLKFFVDLVIGIGASFWICTRKTLDSWSNCYARCVRRGGGGGRGRRGSGSTRVAPNDSELLIRSKHVVSPTLLAGQDQVKVTSLSHV